MRWLHGSKRGSAWPGSEEYARRSVHAERAGAGGTLLPTLLADGRAALEALAAQEPTPALERLVEANTLLSGLGFESSGLAAAHAIHNGLTTAGATHGYMHGEKVAFGVIVQLMLESQPAAVVDEVLNFSCSVGLPVMFEGVGLTEPDAETLEAVARRATAPGETIHNEPFPVGPAIVVEALRAANAAGERFLGRRGRAG